MVMRPTSSVSGAWLLGLLTPALVLACLVAHGAPAPFRKPSDPPRTLEGHKWGVTAVDFHPTKGMLASGSLDRTVRVWDLDNDRSVTLEAPARVIALKFSPDGTCIAVGLHDGTARLWDSKTGKEVAALRGQKDDVWA